MKPGSCVYAHGAGEQRPLPKEELCERYLEGKCNNRRVSCRLRVISKQNHCRLVSHYGVPQKHMPQIFKSCNQFFVVIIDRLECAVAVTGQDFLSFLLYISKMKTKNVNHAIQSDLWL